MIIELVKKLERNRAHQEYFAEDMEKLPGASTISQLGFDKSGLVYAANKLGRQGLYHKPVWDRSRDIGTLCHFMVQCDLEGAVPDMSEYTESEIREATVPYGKFMDWWNGQNFIPLELEMQLVSNRYRYGGTVDIPFVDAKGYLGLLDIKTTEKQIYPEYIVQLSAYEQLLHENLDEQVVKKGVIRASKDPDEPIDPNWIKDTTPHFNVFKAQLALYNAMKGIK